MSSIYDVSNKISSFLEPRKDFRGIEIEARFRFYENSNLEKTEYEFILGLLSSKIEPTYEYSVDYYKGEKRISEINSEYYLTSKKNLFFQKLTLETGHIKFEINKEEKKKISKLNVNDYDFTRQKYRHTFQQTNTKIDVTKVVQEGQIKYEFELEVIKPDKFDKKEFADIVVNYYKILTTYENLLNKFCNHQLSNGKDSSSNFIKRKFISRPRDLKKKDITMPNSILKGFTVSIKADGKPYFLIFHKLGIWLISLTDKIYLSNLSEEFKNLEGTIFIGEYILRRNLKKSEFADSKSVFIPFDTISYRRESTVNKTYLERISYFKVIENFKISTGGVKLLEIYFKKIFDLGNTSKQFYESFNKCFLEKRDIIFYEDGYIFTPINSPFVAEGQFKVKEKDTRILSKYLDVCKFKPIEKRTIDFLIYKRELYSITLDGKEEKFTSLDYSLEFPENLEEKIVEFAPDFSSENIVLKPIRIRDDKERPNGLKQVKENIDSYFEKNPITEDTLLGHDTVLMRNYNNKIKRDLINNIEGYVVDIGSGRGGDIAKFGFNTKIKKILSIEPHPNYADEFEVRLSESPNKDKFKFLRDTKAEDTFKILEGMKNWFPETMHGSKLIITFMISLSFFWSSDENLNKLIETLDSINRFYRNRKGNLNPEIIFYTIDGDKVEKFFDKIKESKISLNTITLKKLNDNELFVDIRDSKTVEQQIEYLVKLNQLYSLLNAESIELSDPDPKNILMSEPELTYLSLFTYGKIVMSEKNIINRILARLKTDTRIGVEDEEGKILTKGEDELEEFPEISKRAYRISTVDMGNSLVHSVLKLLSPEYRKGDIYERLKLVKEVISSTEGEITPEKLSKKFKITFKIYKDKKSKNVGNYLEYILLLEHEDNSYEPIVIKEKNTIHYSFDKNSYLI